MYNLIIKSTEDPILPMNVNITFPYAIIWGYLDVKKKVWRYSSEVYNFNISENLCRGSHKQYRWNCPLTIYDEND